MKYLLRLLGFYKRPLICYYTTDGNHLCPFPNMTDDDLIDYENEFDVPNKTKFVNR